eukprot:SM000053S17396  [mRNA]  locus=s53:88816:90066:- [translate_table: standard]
MAAVASCAPARRLSGVWQFELRPGTLAAALKRHSLIEEPYLGFASVAAWQRILAALGYLLPFLDGVRYGRFLFQQYPVTKVALQPFLPLLQAYSTIPYANLLAFFGLYLAVVQNQSFSRYVRFNTMQAVVLDVLLILPSLVERQFTPRGGMGLEVLILLYNTIFIFIFACFSFGVASCLLGKTPRLPLVADAADAQVPF